MRPPTENHLHTEKKNFMGEWLTQLQHISQVFSLTKSHHNVNNNFFKNEVNIFVQNIILRKMASRI